ncbi:hypothetical protein JCM8202_001472 [Rhodotorula sphaerocarpa]
MSDSFEPLMQAAGNKTAAITGPILEELGNEVDLATCRLLGPFALAIQGIMGAAVLGSLVVKRMRESPRRRWKIWLADISKQVIGQAFVHASNVAISDLIASQTSDNPCSLYALNIITDTTLGVLILYYFLHFSTILMRRYFQPEYQTGFYGSPFSVTLWGEQAAVYVACLTAMKIVVLILFWLFPFLEDIMSWTLSWITNLEAQVFIVMLVIPLIMNLFQFLMIDSFLKSKEGHSPVIGADTDEEALRQGFLDEDEDDDGDVLFDHHQTDDERKERTHADKTGPGGLSLARGGQHTLGGLDDDDLEEEDDDDKYRRKERPRGPASVAHDLLQADDEEAGPNEAIEMRTRHRDFPSYPPPTPPHTSVPTEGSTVLPPYTPRDGAAEDNEGDDGWDNQWSGSEASVSRPASPVKSLSADSPRRTAPRLPFSSSEGPVPVTSEAAVAGDSPRGEDGAEDDWGFGVEEAQETTPSGFGADSPRLPSAGADVRASNEMIEPVAADEEPAEPEGDDWGLELEEEASQPDAAGPAAVSVFDSAPVAETAPRQVAPDDAAAQGSPPVASETPARLSEDDWGFQDDGEDAHTEAPEHAGDIDEPVSEKAEPSRPSSDSATIPAPKRPAATQDAGDDDDLDDWGFQDSPSLTQDAEHMSDLQDRVDRIATGRGVAGGAQSSAASRDLL